MGTIEGYLTEIITFHHVANARSFSKAAIALNLSKAQVSRQIKALEGMLGAQLFHRSTRSIVLTEEGRSLLSFSDDIVRISRQASLTLKKMTAQNSGLIRLTLPSSLGEWISLPLTQELLAEFPGIRVELDFSNLRKDLVEEEFDFALRAMEENDPDLICRNLGRLKDVVIASPAFLKKHGAPKGPRDLIRFPCVLNSFSAKKAEWIFEFDGRLEAVPVSGNFATGTYSTNRLLCLGGLGVSRLPFCLVRDDLAAGNLVDLFPKLEVSTHQLYLVYPLRSYRPIKQEVFKDLLLRWFAAQKYAFL